MAAELNSVVIMDWSTEGSSPPYSPLPYTYTPTPSTVGSSSPSILQKDTQMTSKASELHELGNLILDTSVLILVSGLCFSSEISSCLS